MPYKPEKIPAQSTQSGADLYFVLANERIWQGVTGAVQRQQEEKETARCTGTYRASSNATSCGVDTMTAPDRGSRCPRVICASPVPGHGECRCGGAEVVCDTKCEWPTCELGAAF